MTEAPDRREPTLFALALANIIVLLTLIAVLAIVSLPAIVSAILTGCLGAAVAAFVLIAPLRTPTSGRPVAAPAAIIRIISGRNPFQAVLMGWLGVSGAALMFSAPEPDSVAILLPGWAVYIWGFSFAAGAVFAITGAYWRGSPARSVKLESAGCAIYVLANLVYPIAIVVRITTEAGFLSNRMANSWFAIGFILSLSWAGVVRMAQLRKAGREVSFMRTALNVTKEPSP